MLLLFFVGLGFEIWGTPLLPVCFLWSWLRSFGNAFATFCFLLYWLRNLWTSFVTLFFFMVLASKFGECPCYVLVCCGLGFKVLGTPLLLFGILRSWLRFCWNALATVWLCAVLALKCWECPCYCLFVVVVLALKFGECPCYLVFVCGLGFEIW